MASSIEAIIYDGEARPESLPAGWTTVRLSCGLTMVPVTKDLAETLDQHAGGDARVSAHWFLRQPVIVLGRHLSAGRRALYIFGETFGGTGNAEAIAWQDGRLIYGPSGTCDLEDDLVPGYHLVPHRDSAINVGLRTLGVSAGSAPGQDEYDVAGLSKHRFTKDWIES